MPRGSSRLDRELFTDAASQLGGVMKGDPALTFDLVAVMNDTLVRATGSWVEDEFKATDVITVAGTVSNNGALTVLAISTTTNPNDTLEFAGDVLVDEGPVSSVTITAATDGVANGKADPVFVERTRSAYHNLGGGQLKGIGADQVFTSRAREANADLSITP